MRERGNSIPGHFIAEAGIFGRVHRRPHVIVVSRFVPDVDVKSGSFVKSSCGAGQYCFLKRYERRPSMKRLESGLPVIGGGLVTWLVSHALAMRSTVPPLS